MVFGVQTVGAHLQKFGEEHDYAEQCCSGKAMQPLDAVRRFACGGAAEKLLGYGAPPALLHPSKYASSNFLYGAEDMGLHDDVGYKDGLAPPREMLMGAQLVGCMTMNVDMPSNTAQPALLYWKPKVRELLVVVVKAPIGHMEAILGNTSREGTPFERAWMEGHASDVMDQRREVFSHIRRCGMNKFPTFLVHGNYHVCRDGVMPLLRLSRPQNPAQKAACLEALAAVHDVELGTGTLESCGLVDEPWTANTVFMTGDAADLNTGILLVPQRDSEWILDRSAPSRLSLGILASLQEPEYWGPQITGKPLIENYEGAVVDDGDVCPKFDAQLPSGIEEPTVPTLCGIFEKTQRAGDVSEVIVQFNRPGEVIPAMGAALFQERDRPLVERGLLTGNAGEPVETRIRKLGRLLDERFAILLIVVQKGGRSDGHVLSLSLDCQGEGENGKLGANRWNPKIDECVRLMLCSWVTPLILLGNTLLRVRLSGVPREKLRLSDKAVVDNLPLSGAPVSQGDIVSLTKTISARLDAIESKQKEPVKMAEGVSAPLSEDLKELKRLLPVLEERVRADDKRLRK